MYSTSSSEKGDVQNRPPQEEEEEEKKEKPEAAEEKAETPVAKPEVHSQKTDTEASQGAEEANDERQTPGEWDYAELDRRFVRLVQFGFGPFTPLLMPVFEHLVPCFDAEEFLEGSRSAITAVFEILSGTKSTRVCVGLCLCG
jgi:hypothetical protein